EYPDWFEIYNYGGEDIDIGGMYVKDDTTWWRIPTGHSQQTTVKAGGHLLLWADNDPEQGPLHVDFALGKSSDQIGIYDAFRYPIDIVTFSSQIEDRSRGRLPDGSGNWMTFEIGSATPGGTNRSKPVKVVINEIMYHPGHAINTPENRGEEYIELYNNGEEPLGLLGWRFTNGVNYTVTDDVIIGVGGYYVIASDVAAFKAKYPGVTNVVGGWDGRLSNSGETVELVDQAGVLVDKLRYADQGEWAVRELGPVDYRHRGWRWSDEHDGGGKSLELMNPNMPNEHGQNWAASQNSAGTPGALNSIADNDIAPMIIDVEHSPIIPGPDHAVTVTAEILDELGSGVLVMLHYRIDISTYENGDENIYPHYNPADYTTVSMYDDGAHGDGIAGDGVYGVDLPAHPNGTIIEYFVESRDAAANVRTWPAPSDMSSIGDGMQQVTNALYQVNGDFAAGSWKGGDQPVYLLILTQMEKNRLLDIGDPSGSEYNSNAQMNLTFVSVDGVDTKIRHRVGMRNRGHGSRNDPPNNYKINFVNDRPWKDATAAILNTKFTWLQLVGNSLFRLAGLTEPESAAVQARLNGENMAGLGNEMYGSYVHLEVIDTDFAGNHFPGNSNGNAYKCMRSGGDHANLRYEGPVADADHYRQHYFKETNVAADDWSDLIGLTYALSENTPDSNYVETVRRVADVEQWLRFLAVNTILDNSETTLANGDGDDYYLYCGIEDPHFILIQHDLDSIFGMGDTAGRVTHGIFRFVTDDPGIPALERLVYHPEFIGRYYWHLKSLIETTFSPEQLDPVLDELLGDFVHPGTLQQMKEFAVARNAHILSLIPSDLTVVSDLPVVEGYHQTTAASASLYGTADAIRTRLVLVNGQGADWSGVDGEWSISDVPLNPGINRIIVQAFDNVTGRGNPDTRQVDEEYIDIWYEDGNMSEISGAVASGTLNAASGPWHVTGDVTVGNGVTLAVNPGTTLFFDAGTSITVTNGGRLIAEGTEYNLIRFTAVPGAGYWDGLQFADSMTENRISRAVLEYGQTDDGMIGAVDSNLLLEYSTLDHSERRRVRTVDSSLIVRNCRFADIFEPCEPPSTDNMSEHIWGRAGDTGWFIIEDNVFGTNKGHNDAIDVDGPSRPAPIPQILNNIFLGGGDDALDLESDVHIEGNKFYNFVKDQWNTASGEANVISAGSGRYYVMARNSFYNTQHIAQVKNEAFLTFTNNTVVEASGPAIYFALDLPGRDPGRGADVDGTIFWGAPEVFAGVEPTTELTIDHTMIPFLWHSYGAGNIDADPLLLDIDSGDFTLKPDSGAIGTGNWGLDMGAMVPEGAAIWGEPPAVTYHADATLTIGGPGIVSYKYSVNSPTGPWSAEISVDIPAVLTGLTDGQSYTVYAIGKNSADVWQSEEDAVASHTWTIDTSHWELVINEVLAHTHGNDPDIVELYYDGPSSIDITGMSLTDDPIEPNKFEFSSATALKTTMNPGDYIVLYGDLTTFQNHLGFALSADGEALYLYDKPNPDGSRDLLDSVEFGPQINSYSIGRVGWDRQWKLNKMTFGSANIAQPLGDPYTLKINEWLANGRVLF
ncbi:MAG: lamin tail domain-containing protein, partial [Planctomycetota bacterium]